MSRYQVRQLSPHDFESLMHLEESLFGKEGVLGPYYVRLCCDFFASTCFVALVDGRPAGYVLSFVRDREAYCTTLAVLPEFQGTRVVALLLRSFVCSVVPLADSCWFTVKEDNQAARALHATLGASEGHLVLDYYGPGDSRIVSRIDRDAFERLRAKYERLGLIPPTPRMAQVA